jgi:replication factor C subunit 2/4
MASPFGQKLPAAAAAPAQETRTNIPWVEKYRPAKIDDIAQQEEVVASLKTSLETGDLPNLLLYGPPGTGKTSVALAVCQQFFGKDFKSRVKEMNASDERGISAIREQVKVFAQLAVGTGSDCKYKFRIVILDEADSMTHDAHAALRRIMEEFVQVTRFIIICNYVSKIIEPLHSRCSKFRFKPIDKEFQKQRIFAICKEEGVQISGTALETLITLSKGDMRSSVTMLQTAVNFYGGDVDEAAIVEIACAVPDAAVMKIFRTAQNGTLAEVSAAVKEFFLEGYSGVQCLEQLLELVLGEPSVSDANKADITLLMSQVSQRLTEGCDEELQMLHFFTALRNFVKP